MAQTPANAQTWYSAAGSSSVWPPSRLPVPTTCTLEHVDVRERCTTIQPQTANFMVSQIEP